MDCVKSFSLNAIFMLFCIVLLQACAASNTTNATVLNQSLESGQEEFYVYNNNGINMLKLDNKEYALGDYYYSALGQQCRHAKATEPAIQQDLMLCMNEDGTYVFDSVLIRYIANK